jgi:hypothetical protein
MYETKKQALASSKVFFKRMLWNFAISAIILCICLMIGVLGYHFLAPATWLDAVHNASMILGGMGPVVIIETFWGKIFSSFYALFSGVIFITSIGVLIAPIAHRFFHKMNLED